MSVECDRIQGINLAQGVCDIDPPAPVVQAALAAIQNGHNIYTRLDGIFPLRAEISRKVSDYNGINSDPETSDPGDFRRHRSISGRMHGAF